MRPHCKPLPLPPGRWRVRALLALNAQAAGGASGLLGWLSPAREPGAAAEPAESSRLSLGQAGTKGGDVLAVWQIQAQGENVRTSAQPGDENKQQHSALRGWETAPALLGGAALACLAGAPGAGFDALVGAFAWGVMQPDVGLRDLYGLDIKGTGLRLRQATSQTLPLACKLAYTLYAWVM